MQLFALAKMIFNSLAFIKVTFQKTLFYIENDFQ